MSNLSELNVDRRRAFMLGGGTLIAAVLGTGAATSATAASTQPLSQATSAQADSATLSLTDEQIAAANKFVTQAGQRYELDEAAATRELGAATTGEVRTAVEAWNEQVGGGSTDGAIRPQAGGKTMYTGPHGSISAHWYGLKIHFDSYLAGKVTAGTATASVIAGGIGLATSGTGVGGIAGGVVASALAAASGVIGMCQEEDGSVTWYWLLNGLGACNPFA
ncbi:MULTISPECIES: hypothetical protein [unclassified Brachybacterium]|uniref:hypothetical protein n=1 Tax=unclassified Brachybacterium TaxID=2623841 RepID=UPI00402AABB5